MSTKENKTLTKEDYLNIIGEWKRENTKLQHKVRDYKREVQKAHDEVTSWEVMHRKLQDEIADKEFLIIGLKAKNSELEERNGNLKRNLRRAQGDQYDEFCAEC